MWKTICWLQKKVNVEKANNAILLWTQALIFTYSSTFIYLKLTTRVLFLQNFCFFSTSFISLSCLSISLLQFLFSIILFLRAYCIILKVKTIQKIINEKKTAKIVRKRKLNETENSVFVTSQINFKLLNQWINV